MSDQDRQLDPETPAQQEDPVPDASSSRPSPERRPRR